MVEEKSTNSEKFCGFILPITKDLSEARIFPPHFPDMTILKFTFILNIFQIEYIFFNICLCCLVLTKIFDIINPKKYPDKKYRDNINGPAKLRTLGIYLNLRQTFFNNFLNRLLRIIIFFK
jgi:hypothetical protein